MIRLSGLIDLKELISEEERYYARDPKGKQIYEKVYGNG